MKNFKEIKIAIPQPSIYRQYSSLINLNILEYLYTYNFDIIL
jgi:hypothetical protein